MNPYNSSKQHNVTHLFSYWLVFTTALLLLALLLVGIDFGITRADTPICNGGNCYILHTTITDFAKGNFYATGLHNVPGSDGDIQLLPVGFTEDWKTDASLPARGQLAAVTYSNTLYAIGGQNSSDYYDDIYTATTYITGAITPSGWVLADHLPGARAGVAAVISQTNSGGILYVVAGQNPPGGFPGGTNTIFYKTIATNGSLSSSWYTLTLPVSIMHATAVVRHGNLYILGGGNGIFSTSQNTIYRYPILDATGNLGSYSVYTMPNNAERLAAVTWEGPTSGFLYVVGGMDYPTASSYVNIAAFGSDNSLPSLGSWITRTLPSPFSAHGTVQVNGNIHVVGGAQGINATDAVSQVQSALLDQIPLEGDLHDWNGLGQYWVVTHPIGDARYFHGTTASQYGYVYVIGGYDKNGTPQGGVFRGSTTGTAPTHAPQGSYVHSFDVGSGTNFMTALSWTAELNSSHAITMSYRTSNDPTFTGASWLSPTVSITGLNTIALPNIAQRYLQYQVQFSTNVSNTTPLLSDVKLVFSPPPTPTPTKTPTAQPVPPTPTGALVAPPTAVPGVKLPDLLVASIGAPTDLNNPNPILYTVNISVANLGTTGFNRVPTSLTLSKTARVGQQSGSYGVPRIVPSAIRASSTYTGTTNAWFYVDVYVTDLVPPYGRSIVAPQFPFQLGNCPSSSEGTNWGWIQSLGIGEVVNIPIQCYLPKGSHTYYAQVDTCDYDPAAPNKCSPTYGYILELSEINNIGGPVTSGSNWSNPRGTWLNPLFLPSILKNH
jgi:hypothetical protein